MSDKKEITFAKGIHINSVKTWDNGGVTISGSICLDDIAQNPTFTGQNGKTYVDFKNQESKEKGKRYTTIDTWRSEQK